MIDLEVPYIFWDYFFKIGWGREDEIFDIRGQRIFALGGAIYHISIRNHFFLYSEVSLDRSIIKHYTHKKKYV